MKKMKRMLVLVAQLSVSATSLSLSLLFFILRRLDVPGCEGKERVKACRQPRQTEW